MQWDSVTQPAMGSGLSEPVRVDGLGNPFGVASLVTGMVPGLVSSGVQVYREASGSAERERRSEQARARDASEAERRSIALKERSQRDRTATTMARIRATSTAEERKAAILRSSLLIGGALGAIYLVTRKR